jgi:hypothetical protein
LIQDILKKFVIEKGMTLLTIAHRLQTIIDYDKILGNSNIIINTNILIPLSVLILILILILIVLGDGEVKEFDTAGLQIILIAKQSSAQLGVNFTVANKTSVVSNTLNLMGVTL